MWNYSFSVPSIMMLCIILLYYFLHPRLPIRMNRTFFNLLVTDILVVLFDYASSRADEYFRDFPLCLVWALNMAFFIFFLGRIYYFFRFTADVLDSYGSIPPWIYRLSALLLLVCEGITLSSPLTGAVFFVDGEGYRRGALYNLLYLFFFLFLVFAVLLIMKRQELLAPVETVSLLGCHGILLLGNIVRILLPGYLVMNTFCLMAILILFLSFENPQLFLSQTADAYNDRGFRALARQWHRERTYCVLGFTILNYYEYRGIWGGERMDRKLTQISHFLSETYPEALVFYLRNGSFALAGSPSLDCEAMSRRISKRFAQPWEDKEGALNLDVVFVQASSENEPDSSDRLISTLLIALSNAGTDLDDGRLKPGDVMEIGRQLAIKRALESALEENRLEVFLQPIVNSETGRVVGAEALARIRDRDGRFISPEQFIPVAERDGHIFRLGEQVFAKVCAFLRDNDPKAMGLSWINVNLSPHQCMQKELPEVFGRLLAQYSIPAGLIHLELTEQFMGDFSILSTQIGALETMGFQFALDDYGSGYSNLIRVRQYPFSNIKLDMEVVWDYFRERDPLLPALVAAFHQMRLTITAEGVESEEMADELRSIGCDYLQGFHFSRPIPIDEFLARYAGTPAGAP